MAGLVYRYRVTFEDIDEVERVIDIRAGQTFRDLHLGIQSAIGFDASKPASFYMSGDQWRKGQEISTEKDRSNILMKDARLNNFMNDPHQKILYETDFDSDWSLRVELQRILQATEGVIYPAVVRSVGEAPKQYKPSQAGGDLNEFDEMVSEFVMDLPADGTETLDEMEGEPMDQDLFEEDED